MKNKKQKQIIIRDYLLTTYNNKKNKINPVPKRVCILDVIHYSDPTFQTDNLREKNKNKNF